MTPDCSASTSGGNTAYDPMTGLCSLPDTLEELTVGHVLQAEHMCPAGLPFVSVMKSCAEEECQASEQACQKEPGKKDFVNGIHDCSWI